MNEERRNWVLFVVLAVLVIFGGQFLTSKFFPPANPPVTKVDNGKTVPVSSAPVTTAAKVRDRNQVLGETPRVKIVTPSLNGSINLKGARIDDLLLPTYKETIDKNSAPIRLFSPSGTANAYFASFGWSGDGVQVPNADTVFTASAPELSPGKPVTLSWVNATGQRFAIQIAVDDKFMFTVTQQVANAGAAPVKLQPFAAVSRQGPGADVTTATNHVGPIGVFGNGADYDIDYTNLDGKEASFFGKIFGNHAKPGDNHFDAKGGWVGFGDKYWLAALIPDQNAAVKSGFPAADKQLYQADVALNPVTVAPGKAVSTTTRLFAGAKEVATLNAYTDDPKNGIALFDRAIDWGWFRVVEKPIFTYLDFLFRMVGNFGVAIILLTVTIRALIFPIAQRQFASMAAMKAIQPKMKAIQERYKDDKPRQQQEVMALYKAEGVNPLAGCLPTFLQIPIMYSLYKVLLLSIEMRHQPFVLWIKDLSAPDPFTPLNLFGYLHFTPPHLIAIGVIPILLGVSMYFQFKLNPAPMDEAQKQVFAIMPWVLMFVMAPFAVGLQVYWITSNCITILQQRLLYARHPGLKTAVAK